MNVGTSSSLVSRWDLPRPSVRSERCSTVSPRTTTLYRQGYPAVLVDAAVARGRLVDGSRVLEVGCGTGKLTELLAAHQLNVDAVDPGPRMIEQAKRRVGGTRQRSLSRRAVRRCCFS